MSERWIGGRLELTRDGDGRVVEVVCVPGVGHATPREACWIEPTTGEVFVNHRHNAWCCVPLDRAMIVPASSSGVPLSWELAEPVDNVGLAGGLLGVFCCAVILAAASVVVFS